MKFTIRHRFHTDLDAYWNRVFFDREYNRRLYQEILKFRRYELVEQRDTGGGAITRTLKLEPGIDAPAVVRKVLGDRFSYTEIGNFDPQARRWRYRVLTSVLSEKVTIGGDFWAESRGEKEIERICEVNIEARIFGVGGMIESYVEKETRHSYEQAAQFTNQFIKEKGL